MMYDLKIADFEISKMLIYQTSLNQTSEIKQPGANNNLYIVYYNDAMHLHPHKNPDPLFSQKMHNGSAITSAL